MEAVKVTFLTLGKSDDFSVRGLIEVNTKTKKHFRGYFHPRAAMVIALNWFEPVVASHAMEWLYRYLTGDISLAKDIFDRADAANNTKSLTTRTTVETDEPDAKLLLAHSSSTSLHCDAASLERTSFLVSTGKRKRPDNDLIFEASFVESLTLLDKRWDLTKEPKTKQKYVYFLRMKGTLFVKIGFASDVLTRLRHLQIGNAVQLELEFKFKTKRFRELESRLHRISQNCHVQGEWFSFAPETNFSQLVTKICKLKRSAN